MDDLLELQQVEILGLVFHLVVVQLAEDQGQVCLRAEEQQVFLLLEDLQVLEQDQ